MNSVRVCYNNSNSFFIRNRRQKDAFYINETHKYGVYKLQFVLYVTQKAPKDLQLLNRRTRSGKFIEEELLYAVDPMDPHMGWTTS